MLVLLKTERLVLRRFTEADADGLFDLDGDPEVMRFLTGRITVGARGRRENGAGFSPGWTKLPLAKTPGWNAGRTS